MAWLSEAWLSEAIVVAAFAFLVIGIVCIINGRGHDPACPQLVFGISMGIALITSGFIALAVSYLQGRVEHAANEDEAAASAEREEARADQAISLTSSISGFNPEDLPPGVELRKINFNGKTFDAAQLEGAKLPGEDFQDAVLTRANLKGADLSGANLIGVDLTDAELTGADLSGADLRGARFEHAAIEQAKSLKGAKVNDQTCWPQGFFRSVKTWRLAVGLVSPQGRDEPALVSAASTADAQQSDGPSNRLKVPLLENVDNHKFGQICTQVPTKVIRKQYEARPKDDGMTFEAQPPEPGARVQRIDWLTATNADVTWIVEPSDG
jgi:hypothetical protein